MLKILFVNLKCWFILMRLLVVLPQLVQVITMIIHHAVP